MKKIIVSSIFVIIQLYFTSLFSQNLDFDWVKDFRGSQPSLGRSLAVDSSGNVFSCGTFAGTVDFDPGLGVYNLSTPSNSNYEAYVSKLDNQGNFVWAIQIPQSEACTKIVTDVQGNVYVIGRFGGTVDFDPGPSVFNLTSNPLYQDTYYLLKLTNNGGFVWAKIIGGNALTAVGVYSPTDMCFGLPNELLITGIFGGTADFDPTPSIYNLSSLGDFDVFIQKLDTAGNFTWAKSIGGPQAENHSHIAVNSANEVVVTGGFNGTADFDPGPGVSSLTSISTSYNAYVLKLTPNGAFVWVKHLENNSSIIPNAIICDNNDNIYTTGEMVGTTDFDPNLGVVNLTSNGQRDIYISKLSLIGNYMWAYSCGSNVTVGTESGYGLAVDSKNSLYVTGVYLGTTDFDPGPAIFNVNSQGNEDIFILKLDSIGGFDFVKTMGGSFSQFSRAIEVDLVGNVYTTGYYRSTCDFDPGTGVFNLVSPIGKDKAYVHKLKVCDSQATITTTSCDSLISPSSNYTWYVSGIYKDTLPNATGCDSVITINLIIKNSSNSSISQTICNGQNYTSPSGKIFSTSGMYLDTIANSVNCDSLITINLVVGNNSASTINPFQCGGNYNSPGGNTYSASGTYTDTIPNTAGCDSVITINLTINNNVAYSTNLTSCDSAQTQTGGNWYYTSQVVIDTLLGQAANGCDSIVTTTLTINNSQNTSNVINACPSELPIIIHGVAQSTAGIYSNTMPGQNGCDSTSMITLNINNAAINNQTINACDSILFNSNWYFNTTTINDTIIGGADNGCDSITLITITITTTPTITITPNTATIYNGENITLTANGGNSYLWDNSSTNSNIIVNPTQTTTYCVTGSNTNNSSVCSNTACATITVIDLDCNEGKIFIPTGISPNGDNINDQLCVFGKECIGSMNLSIYDRWGNLVYQTDDIESCWDGTYRGQQLNTAVYVFYFEAILKNKETVKLKGNLSLIR